MRTLELPFDVGRKLAGRVRSDGLTGTLKHARIVGLHRLHEALPPAAARGLPPTEGKVELSELHIPHPSKVAGVHYLPTPWRVLDWVHAALPADKSNLSFIDMGAGKGRAVMSAALHGYKRAFGIEFAPELAIAAEANIRRIPARPDQHVAIRCEDAGRAILPDGPLVVFLFNPFGPPVIDHVARSIAESNRRMARPIWVAYLNPQHPTFDHTDGLSRIELSRDVRARFALASPYQLALYATRSAQEWPG